mgnify:CR=1 FL=1
MTRDANDAVFVILTSKPGVYRTEVDAQAEIVDRHTTLYVKRQLPERIVEGHTLAGADVAEIRDLIWQRDAHIMSLYAENTSLRKAQDAGLGGNLLYQKGLKDAFNDLVNRDVGKFKTADLVASFCDRCVH